MNENMLQQKTWEEFRESKMLWWVNRLLQTFGWSIVVIVDDDGNIDGAYPARTQFRGFDEATEAAGFRGISDYMVREAETLAKEANS